MLKVSEHIDICAKTLTPKYQIFPFYKMYSESINLRRAKERYFILRLHYVPGGHGGHVSDNRDQNGITVRQRRGTG